MKIALVFAAIISAVVAFGPRSVPLVTKTTTPPIDCDGRPSDYTTSFCEYRPNKLFQHPNHSKWFIDCFSRTCQRCGPSGVLELNEDCQMCLGPGQQCPKPQPDPVEIECPNDGCPFCPEHLTHGGFTHHQNPTLYCHCVWGDPFCMPCPCGQVFDRKKQCCVPNKAKGRKCH